MNALNNIYDTNLEQREDSYLAVKYPAFFLYILIALLYLGFVFITERYYPVVFIAIITENYWGENATFFAFLAAAYLLACLVLQKGPRFRRIVWAAAAIMFAFIAMEEISWGMWVHKIGPPEWFKEINAQDELTIHNIEGLVERKQAIQETVAWLLVAWSVFSVVMMLLRRRFAMKSVTALLPIFPLRILPFAILVAWLFTSDPFIKSEEIAELALALLALFWSSDLYVEFSERQPKLIERVSRNRWSSVIGVAALTCLFSLAAQQYYPQAVSGRLTRTAVEN